jgi:hypothetical protein
MTYSSSQPTHLVPVRGEGRGTADVALMEVVAGGRAFSSSSFLA